MSDEDGRTRLNRTLTVMKKLCKNYCHTVILRRTKYYIRVTRRRQQALVQVTSTCTNTYFTPQVYSVLVLNKNFVQQPIISFLYMCAQNNIQKLNILSKRLLMKHNRAKSTRPQDRKVSQQFLSLHMHLNSDS